MQKVKRILTDVLGVVLMIAAPLLGWLPGPGGIPLFIAGLTLLSNNHDWARRLLDNFKERGFKFVEKLPTNNKWFTRMVDFLGVALALLGVWYIVIERQHSFVYGTLYITLGLILLGISGDRYKKFSKR